MSARREDWVFIRRDRRTGAYQAYRLGDDAMMKREGLFALGSAWWDESARPTSFRLTVTGTVIPFDWDTSAPLFTETKAIDDGKA